jgi:hypothetical protein
MNLYVAFSIPKPFVKKLLPQVKRKSHERQNPIIVDEKVQKHLIRVLEYENCNDKQSLFAFKKTRLMYVFSKEIADCVETFELAEDLLHLNDLFRDRINLRKDELIYLRNFVKKMMFCHNTMPVQVYELIVCFLLHHKAISDQYTMSTNDVLSFIENKS